MTEQGTLSSWNPERGFGFIKTDSDQLFVHIKACSPKPSAKDIGTTVHFKRGQDPKGRPCALDVRMQIAARRRLALLPAPLLGAALIGGLSIQVSNGQYPAKVLYLLLITSLISFVLYAKDKAAAIAGRWRVRESTLHLFALIGGWPGAALAQFLLWHKSSKQPFRMLFWSCVLINSAAVLWTFTPNGEYFLYSHLIGLDQWLELIRMRLQAL